MLFQGSSEQLNAFLSFLNESSQHLKFTMNYDKVAINFLDLMITVGEDHVLYTNLYQKPTDRNSFLSAQSHHPLPLKNSLPYSQFCRIKRICKKPTDLNQHMNNMQNKFRERGYSESQIDNARSKINEKNRSNLLERQPNSKSQPSCVLSTCYSKCAEQFKKIVYEHWHILSKDKSLSGAFATPPLVVFSRGQNLRDHLVRSDLPPRPIRSQLQLAPVPHGNYRCGSCTQCNFTHKCHDFRHPHSGRKIPIKGVIRCSTEGVIYLLSCPCGKAYVGKTTRALKVCIAEHRSSIRCKNTTYPVAAHFVEANHTVSSLRYIGIEQVSKPRRGGDFDSLLLQREAAWIYKLQTLAPHGLNVEFDLRPFL